MIENIEFKLGDVVYYTLSPTELIKGIVYRIGFDVEGVYYSIPSTAEAFNWFKGEYAGVKNVYGTEQEAKEACKKWGLEKGKILIDSDIKVNEQKTKKSINVSDYYCSATIEAI